MIKLKEVKPSLESEDIKTSRDDDSKYLAKIKDEVKWTVVTFGEFVSYEDGKAFLRSSVTGTVDFDPDLIEELYLICDEESMKGKKVEGGNILEKVEREYDYNSDINTIKEDDYLDGRKNCLKNSEESCQYLIKVDDWLFVAVATFDADDKVIKLYSSPSEQGLLLGNEDIDDIYHITY